jgi:hypothetical protein
VHIAPATLAFRLASTTAQASRILLATRFLGHRHSRALAVVGVVVVVQAQTQVLASRLQVELRACTGSVEEPRGLGQRHVRRGLVPLATSIIRNACRRMYIRMVVRLRVRHH